MLTYYSPPLFAHSEEAAEAHADQYERAMLGWIEADQVIAPPAVPATLGALAIELLGAFVEWLTMPRCRGRR